MRIFQDRIGAINSPGRHVAGVVLFIFFCLGGLAHAAPCYGTRMPEGKQLFLGIQSYSVLDRNLDKDYGKLHSQQEFLLISYGLLDWLSLDLKGGAGNIRSRGQTGVEDIDYSTYLAGGYGVRLKLVDREATKLVFGFQHISVHPFADAVGAVKHKAVLDDWQFSLLASHEIFNVTPYLGTRWAWMNKIHWIDTNRKLEKSDLGQSVGLIAGLDIPLTKKSWVNVEGQFLDATAVAGSINVSF